MEKSCSREGILPVTEPTASSGRAASGRCEKLGEALNIFWILVAFSMLAFALTIFLCYFAGCQIEVSAEAARTLRQNGHAPGVRRLSARELSTLPANCRPLVDPLYQLACNNQALCRAAFGDNFDDAPLGQAPAEYAVQFTCRGSRVEDRVERFLLVHETYCHCKSSSNDTMFK
ncbi:uncharacterized protein LOC135934028 [Cloeon dipterum]|uniref:uncharacterized protein LOC135934028 n=1 Tax=Cloeon dipterum TaxID=197152 RepID=UPI003220664C